MKHTANPELLCEINQGKMRFQQDRMRDPNQEENGDALRIAFKDGRSQPLTATLFSAAANMA